MLRGLPRTQDFWAGVMFTAFGVIALVVGSNYSFGTTWRMGPGYFPLLLGAILSLLGLAIAVRGLVVPGAAPLPGGRWRPFLTMIGVLAFAVLLPWAGLVIASLVLIVVSALGADRLRPVQVLTTSAILIGMVLAIFSWGLGLTIPILPRL
jgi:hypothetical protein